MSALLEGIDLNTYYGASHVLHGVTLALGAGETVTLMGRNGMGKTTTIRSLLGLTPPRSGEVRVRGQAVTGWPAHRVAAQGIALVPEGRGIFPTLTVLENLMVAARPGPWTRPRAGSGTSTWTPFARPRPGRPPPGGRGSPTSVVAACPRSMLRRP